MKHLSSLLTYYFLSVNLKWWKLGTKHMAAAPLTYYNREANEGRRVSLTELKRTQSKNFYFLYSLASDSNGSPIWSKTWYGIQGNGAAEHIHSVLKTRYYNFRWRKVSATPLDWDVLHDTISFSPMRIYSKLVTDGDIPWSSWISWYYRS